VSRRLLLSYLSLAAVVLLLLEVPLGVSYASNQRRDQLTRLEHDASYVGSFAQDAVQGGLDARLRTYARNYADEADAQIAIVDRHGLVLADSSARLPKSLGSRPEIAQALAGHASSGTLGSSLYAAAPVVVSRTVYGAVRVSMPVGEVNTRILSYVLRLLAIAAAVLGLVALVGWLLSRWVVRPLQAVEEAAERAGRGDLAARAPEEGGPPEVRTLARSFNGMVSRLEQLLHAQEEFVADASHQLRTPLTALRLRLETGDSEGALTEAERLSRLVDGLLALSRAEVSAPEQVDLAAAVADRLDAWEPVASQRGVRLAADVSGFALVGPDRLSQVLDNLLANALAVAPAGTTVSVTGDAEALHVQDQGPGMSNKERRRAFDRFWSKGSGSGLGLPIAKRLVAADGGTVELHAGAAGGLDVVLRLRPADDRHPVGARPTVGQSHLP
jgi:signal transduction histidine kinase